LPASKSPTSPVFPLNTPRSLVLMRTSHPVYECGIHMMHRIRVIVSVCTVPGNEEQLPVITWIQSSQHMKDLISPLWIRVFGLWDGLNVQNPKSCPNSSRHASFEHPSKLLRAQKQRNARWMIELASSWGKGAIQSDACSSRLSCRPLRSLTFNFFTRDIW
jgi:hypothetical protein